MIDDDDILHGTIGGTVARLKLAYGSGVQVGEDTYDTKLLAADLIVCMKSSGVTKAEFLKNLGFLWDDIQLESIQ